MEKTWQVHNERGYLNSLAWHEMSSLTAFKKITSSLRSFFSSKWVGISWFLLVKYFWLKISDPDLRLSKNGLELIVNKDAFQVTFVSKAKKQRCSTSSPRTFLEKSRVNTSKERKVLQDNPFLQTLLSLAVSDRKKAFSPSFQALGLYIYLVSK